MNPVKGMEYLGEVIINLLKSFLNWFWKLHRSVVLKNSKLKGLHSGETCLIFGNGGSLKYYDFSVLPKLPAICTTYSLADKRIADVDVRYWVVPDSYSLYPVIYNFISNKIQRNLYLPIMKRIASENQDITLISSLTNYYSFFQKKVKNVVYFHHFGEKQSLNYDLADKFTTCSGSLPIMLGVARFLGFSKVILLGCDYLGSPKLEGHFYADRTPFIGIDDPEYVSRIAKTVGDMEVLVVFPKGYESSIFKSVYFGEYFGCTEKYQANYEFIYTEYLVMMRKASKAAQIYM